MKTMDYRDGSLWLLDQRALPHRTTLLECRDHSDVAAAIRTLSVRGAPAIGIAAAYGVVLAALRLREAGARGDAIHSELQKAVGDLRATRPTAVNLSWALDRMLAVLRAARESGEDELFARLLKEADRIRREDEEASRSIGELGAALIPHGARVLTHCNTGSLVSAFQGTALAAILTAHQQGKHVHVWVDETRPLLQGARLTAWELKEAGVPFTLITDSMAGHFMAGGQVDLVMVGADRVAANGDAANKIGTYSVAVLANAHGIRMYVAAPLSTVDLATPSGADSPIEVRKEDEVTSVLGVRVAPEGATAGNPAFDVTPARLIDGIVTERGVIRPPFGEGLVRAKTAAREPSGSGHSF